MASGPNANKRTVRRRKADPTLWVAECDIEPTALPDQVDVSLLCLHSTGACTNRPTTRRFRLDRDRANELINALMKALADADGHSRPGEQTAALPPPQALPSPNDPWFDTEENDSMTDHFALGVYGLVGN